MKIRAISGAMLAALSLAALPAVAASNSLTFQGVTFNTDALDADTQKLEILNATSATGNWAGVNWLKAFEIKDIGNVTAASIVSGPGSFAADVTQGLSANVGCTTGSTNGACFTGSPIALTSAMTWVIDFTGTGLNFATPHLKVQFLKTAGQDKATGDLLSREIPPIPEPETYAMMLAGMGLVGFIARRRRAEQGKA
ncbi:PEP-CTERM sorting domain-containing protein [Accumulibacter sp.]|uniref:PEP-CTERM sorting domain-containing protein n=1 Tax=Accumulibacter sp. TaxID=2053492 RepID=UPI0025F807D0|nr:PEP-CTERM sorting domain-containing protein [Accumulibacter sp.]MCM8612678.1 PEP-CTERM sorting domain-containing protein [Accumulibacter sp.]MCM8636482.1 PEP-CTERM sorting domain-containing protein [Accumulibacter sp.]MCM8639373.1 PEP-CTERM sorting domain-containing protein [Accumulibacter sp.]